MNNNDAVDAAIALLEANGYRAKKVGGQGHGSDHAFKDLTGQRFGKLVAVRRLPRDPTKKHQAAMWQCRCDCGATHQVRSTNLRNGSARSCGCLRIEILRSLWAVRPQRMGRTRGRFEAGRDAAAASIPEQSQSTVYPLADKSR